MKGVWKIVVEQMKRAIVVQGRYYDSHHKFIEFEVGDLVLLNTINLRMENMSEKVKRKLVGLELSKELVDKIID